MGAFGIIWRRRFGRKVVALKSPRWPVIYSERLRLGVRVIPLGFGWRITIRTTP